MGRPSNSWGEITFPVATNWKGNLVFFGKSCSGKLCLPADVGTELPVLGVMQQSPAELSFEQSAQGYWTWSSRIQDLGSSSCFSFASGFCQISRDSWNIVFLECLGFKSSVKWDADTQHAGMACKVVSSLTPGPSEYCRWKLLWFKQVVNQSYLLWQPTWMTLSLVLFVILFITVWPLEGKQYKESLTAGWFNHFTDPASELLSLLVAWGAASLSCRKHFCKYVAFILGFFFSSGLKSLMGQIHWWREHGNVWKGEKNFLHGHSCFICVWAFSQSAKILLHLNHVIILV